MKFSKGRIGWAVPYNPSQPSPGPRGSRSHPRKPKPGYEAACCRVCVKNLFEVYAGLGNSNTILAGDFNVGTDQSRAISGALNTGFLWDLGKLQAASEGSEPKPTCFQQTKSKGTRIDLILAALH